jgi:hypothetical protein
MVELIAGGVAAYVVGAFTPSIGRKIKAAFVKEAPIVEAAIVTDLNKLNPLIIADAVKVVAAAKAELAKLV